MNKGNSPNNLVQLSLKQAAPEHTSEAESQWEQYRTPSKHINKRQGDIPFLNCKQDGKIEGIGVWNYYCICNNFSHFHAVKKIIICTAVLAVVMVKYSPGHRRWQVLAHGWMPVLGLCGRPSSRSGLWCFCREKKCPVVRRQPRYHHQTVADPASTWISLAALLRAHTPTQALKCHATVLCYLTFSLKFKSL